VVIQLLLKILIGSVQFVVDRIYFFRRPINFAVLNVKRAAVDAVKNFVKEERRFFENFD
jgi:hypothetical protein